jgi:hypothetical protein
MRPSPSHQIGSRVAEVLLVLDVAESGLTPSMNAIDNSRWQYLS